MLLRTITGLTDEQKRALQAVGIGPQRLTDWRNGRRLPTEPQVALLAGITNVDRHELQDEIALLRATPEQRKVLERVMGKIARGVAASFVLAACVAAGIAGLSTKGPVAFLRPKNAR